VVSQYNLKLVKKCLLTPYGIEKVYKEESKRVVPLTLDKASKQYHNALLEAQVLTTLSIIASEIDKMELPEVEEDYPFERLEERLKVKKAIKGLLTGED